MLILSRKDGQGVLIGDDIYVKIIESGNGTVKIGFDAPSDMMILRDELKTAVEEANRQANQNLPDDFIKNIKDRLK